MSYLNSDIQKVLAYVNTVAPTKRNRLSYKSITVYWEKADAITWDNLCTFCNVSEKNGLKPYQYTLALLICSLEYNVFSGEYSDRLHQELPLLKELCDSKTNKYAALFAGGYDDVVIARSKKTEKLFIRRFNGKKGFFRDLYTTYLQGIVPESHASIEIEREFPLSTGQQEIRDYTDINSETFWNQIRYYQNLYAENDDLKGRSIETVCRFYRWLVSEYSDYDFFAGSSNLTTELVLNNALVKNINRGAYFTTFTKNEDLGDKPLICFIIRNMDAYSTVLKKVDHFVLNTENVNTSFYRSLVISYIQNIPSVTKAISGAFTNYITNALHFVEELKRQPDYPNPSIYRFNTAEAVLIRNYFEKDRDHRNLVTLNNRIGAVRRFFQWCKTTDKLLFDDTFFDYLSQYEEPNMYHGEAIPDSDLRKITEAFKAACQENPLYLPYYAIFLIQVETEFRVSQVCGLKISALQPTMKEDQFLIYSNTKTTNGKKTQQPICLSTKKILETVIDETQVLRDESASSIFAENIFLKKGRNGAVIPITSSIFLDVFQEICEKAGVRKYTSRNLRDTHMTKAFEFILKSGKSDLEMGLLSKHSHIDTTKSHYIEMELTKMLESTYEVILDSRDINQRAHVLSELPDTLKDNDSVVEGGCGHCKASMCAIQGSTPCLICSHFVTTAAHKQYFIKMIDMVERRLKTATIPHEIEDLNLRKKLYVNWLREIYIHEEEENAEHSDC